ncbi:endonuclease [Psychrobacillus sp. FSL K6-2836]|uniref:endonuclease n=1 Tax=Psychrobacillus sp. FSL K6-2836 TaxID=2921548 RepID=UPI0030F50885
MSKWSWKKPINAFLSASLVAGLVLPAMPSNAVAAMNAPDLIISEYIEGSSFNKAIELYNGTEAEIDLSTYTLELYSNGSKAETGTLTATNNLSLKGTLASGETYVIHHKDANDAIKSKGNLEDSSVINFNGNDQVTLLKSGSVIDSIGQVGSIENALADVSLVRNPNVIAGDTIIDDAFDWSSQWTDLGKDNFTNIGSHSMDSGDTPPVETKVSDVKASTPSSSVSAGTEIELSTNTEGATIYYTTDGTEPSSSSIEYTSPIIINADTTIKAIAIKDGLDNSDITSLTYTILAVQSISEAREALNETVQIEGIVTTEAGPWGSQAFYMQDETAGMYIYAGSASVQPGDKISVTGKVITYSSEIEIEPTNIEVISSDNEIPNAQVVTPSGVNDDTQGELVALENIEITDLSQKDYGTFEFQALAENGEKVLVRHDNRTGVDYSEFIKYFNEGDKVNLTGIAAVFNNVFQFKTLGLKSFDLVNKPAVYASKYAGTVPVNTQIELASGLDGAEIYYTIDGSEPTTASTKYVGAITLTETTTIKAIAVTNEKTSDAFSFTYTIIKAEDVTIRDIQGNDHRSPYVGASVKNITGVVTHKIDGSNFVMQDIENADADMTTSEAIQINKSSHGVTVGDKVTVAGTVEENGSGTNLTTTRIKATTVAADGTAALPEPLVVGVDINPPNKIIDNDKLTSFNPSEDGIDFWESVEFMRVSFPNAKVIGTPYSGDIPIVAENTTNNDFNVLGGLNIAKDDYNPEKVFLDINNNNYITNSGDYFTGDIIGVISYGNSNFKVLAVESELPEITRLERTKDVTTIETKEDQLTVAAYNIENFSTNTNNTPDEKVVKIAKSFVDNMKSPDIITLVEVQDTDGETNSGNSDATGSYERLIAAITANGGPTYNWTDVAPVDNTNGGAPGANIRVGYLYNPKRVTLVEGTKGAPTAANSWDEEGSLVLNPGVIEPANFTDTRKPIAAEFEFKGERVVVIGAHLNSKGGDEPLFGKNQPPYLGSEAERLGLATTINEFIQDGLATNPNLNVVLAGDMNDFEFTPVMDKLKGDQLTNMVDLVPAEDRFSYFFQGNNQVLDHILVSNNLVNNTVVDMIHINANFTEAQGRASDHDPVLVQIDLAAAEDVALKTYNIKNLKTKKLTLSKPSVSVTLDDQSVITDGIVFTGAKYAEFRGAGFANTTVTLKPSEANAIIDFKGTNVQKVIIDGTNIKEIRGAENIQAIEYLDGASEKTVSFTNTKGEPIVVPSLDDEDIELESYYKDALGKEGKALKTALHEIIDDHTELSYSQVWEALRETDEDPGNPNNVILFYSGQSRSKTLNGGNNGDWNREHTWAKSHGDFGTSNGPGTDIHHLRPTDVQVNGSRGNLDFDNGGSRVINCAQCKGDSDSFEPPNYVKGDVARILFYMATRYEAGDRVDLELNEKVNNGKDPFHGKLSVLLQWHEQDPVDEFERNRNNVIQEWQGNRNPFIDHPEFAELIW